MKYGIIGGTGIYKLQNIETKQMVIETQYGSAIVFVGKGENDDIVFLTRHGIDHSIPPHKINFLANIAALKKLKIKRVLATYCVGSLTKLIKPGDMVVLDQFIDFAPHRMNSFFQGKEYGLGHTDLTYPYCTTLREAVIDISQKRSFDVLPNGTYLCFNGPRFETAAEIRMFAQLGGDVIGMTGATETTLAREAGLHYSAVAYSINYGAGIMNERITFEMEGISEKLTTLINIFIEVLRSPFTQKCNCDDAVEIIQEPKINLFE